jgi:hypothetical protein
MEQEDGPFHFPQREVPNSICDDDRLSLSPRLENDSSDNHFAGPPEKLARVGARAVPNRFNIIQRLDGKIYLI